MFDTPDESHTGLAHDLPLLIGNVPTPTEETTR